MYSIHIWFTGLNFLPCGWDKVFGAPWADPDPADMRAKIKQTRRNCISCITRPFAALIQGNLFVGFLGILMSISVMRTTGSGNPMKYFWDEAVLLQIDNIFNSGMFLARIFVTPHCLYQWLHETPTTQITESDKFQGYHISFGAHLTQILSDNMTIGTSKCEGGVAWTSLALFVNIWIDRIQRLPLFRKYCFRGKYLVRNTRSTVSKLSFKLWDKIEISRMDSLVGKEGSNIWTQS